MSLRPHVTFDVASENDKLIPAILEPSQISFGHSLGWENITIDEDKRGGGGGGD